MIDVERGLTVSYAKECMRYEDGKLFWNIRPPCHFGSDKSWRAWNTKFSNKQVGSSNSNDESVAYLRFGLTVGGKVKLFLVHRVIWAIVKGSFPSKFLDHIDGDILNNQIDNLQDVSNQKNTQNSRMYSHNTSGLTGVSWDNKWSFWRVQGGGHSSGTYVYLGITRDWFEAACIRKSWEIINGYSERHGK